eukprot:3780089-Rhodomonas_salina.5
MWMSPVPDLDFDQIMELLEAGVKRLVQTKRMASQWCDCSVSPNEDKRFGYLALTRGMALKRDAAEHNRSKKAHMHTLKDKDKENKHSNVTGKWFVDSDSNV